MNKKMLYLATVLVCAVALNRCDESDNDNPIVGDWHVNYSVGSGNTERYFIGDWQIDENETYYLEFTRSAGGIIGPTSGYSSGSYRMISDSIMIVTSIEHENLGWSDFFHRTVDTLLLKFQGSDLIATQATIHDTIQHTRTALILEWKRQ